MPFAMVKHIDIGVKGSQDIKIQVSELDLFAVVRSLVDNAIRYTPENGRVDLSVRLSDDRAVLRIEDTGPGIPDHEWERVCAPFYRMQESHLIGSGLGLSIVKSIVDRMGAEVRL